MGRSVCLLLNNIGIALRTADVVMVEDGRLAFLIQVRPEDDELFNRNDGQFPCAAEGKWAEVPDDAELIFDPTTLDDEFFTFRCGACDTEFVDRRMVGPRLPICPKCEPET